MSHDSDMDYSDNDNDCEFEDYYSPEGLDDIVEPATSVEQQKKNPEYFEYTCLDLEAVQKLLNESVEQLSNDLQLIPSLAKVLLQENNWNVAQIVAQYRSCPSSLLIAARIKPSACTLSLSGSGSSISSHHSSHSSTSATTTTPQYAISPRGHTCSVCYTAFEPTRFAHLSCGHAFCRDCWTMHFEVQVGQGISTGIGCMASKCDVRAPEDMVLSLLTRPMLREKFQQFAFRDFVKSHPQLRFCPGPNCEIIVRSGDRSPKKVVCRSCQFSFCFVCGHDYHAPTDCATIQRWRTKCRDDSETANYISAHTKDCPKCHICIEKNGGCNHMQCLGCKYDFCWMCLRDWKDHGSEYYECSRYKENPHIANEPAQTQAREALKKYLHYFERWENHSKSLQLEQQTLNRLRDRIDERVKSGAGTWIDWQYLFDAAALLAKCRYTLQFTYPYAYFMEAGARKMLFEYQQAKLETEIENLSWKIERAETIDRGDVENQMDIAEKWRMTLLREFFPSTATMNAEGMGSGSGSGSGSGATTSTTTTSTTTATSNLSGNGGNGGESGASSAVS